MYKNLLLIIICAFLQVSLQAQNKKELIAEVNELKSSLAQKDSLLVASQKQERISVAKAESFENQVLELQAANATLLKNLKIFTEASSRRSESIGQTLESLREKEAQLKLINDQFAKNDSIALLVLTDLKKTLGEEAKIAVDKGTVAIVMSQASMFGEDDSSLNLTPEAGVALDKIGQLMGRYPDWVASVESQENGMIDKPVRSQQSGILVSKLSDSSGNSADRVYQSRKETLVNAFHIRLHPRYQDFYLSVRESLKK